MIVEISERAVPRQYFLHAIASSAVLLLIAKVITSWIQFKLADDSVSAKNFVKESSNNNSQTNGMNNPHLLNVPNGKQTNGDHFKQDQSSWDMMNDIENMHVLI